MPNDKTRPVRRPVIKPAKGYRLYGYLDNSDRIADAFYSIKEIIPESRVPIPTEDAVIEAKRWVDDGSKL